MLKLYADIFKFDSSELTVKNLNKLKSYTIGGVAGLPFMAYFLYGGIEGRYALIAAFIGVFLTIPLLIVMLSPFANRFWARDKFLDEWELGRKHHAMAIGHQVTDYMFVILASVFFIAAQFSDKDVTLNLETMASLMMGVVIFMVLVPHIFLLWTVKPVDLGGDAEDAEFEKHSKRNLRLWLIWGLIIGVSFVVGILMAHEGNAFYDAGYKFGYWLGSMFRN